jgi:hypothetical protein
VMWILFLIVVHNSNPNDIPGKITLEFKTEQQCREALKSMYYWTKFSWFKSEGKCYERNKIDPELIKNMIKG